MLFFLPRIPVFQTVFTYLRPETILLETLKVNLRRNRLPSFRVNKQVLGFVTNGIGKIMSDLPGDTIERLNILTSGSLLSALNQENTQI